MKNKFLISNILVFLLNIIPVNAAILDSKVFSNVREILLILFRVTDSSTETLLLFARISIFMFVTILVFAVLDKYWKRQSYDESSSRGSLLIALVFGWSTSILLPKETLLLVYGAYSSILISLLFLLPAIGLLYLNFKILPGLGISDIFLALSRLLIFSLILLLLASMQTGFETIFESTSSQEIRDAAENFMFINNIAILILVVALIVLSIYFLFEVFSLISGSWAGTTLQPGIGVGTTPTPNIPASGVTAPVNPVGGTSTLHGNLGTGTVPGQSVSTASPGSNVSTASNAPASAVASAASATYFKIINHASGMAPPLPLLGTALAPVIKAIDTAKTTAQAAENGTSNPVAIKDAIKEINKSIAVVNQVIDKGLNVIGEIFEIDIENKIASELKEATQDIKDGIKQIIAVAGTADPLIQRLIGLIHNQFKRQDNIIAALVARKTDFVKSLADMKKRNGVIWVFCENIYTRAQQLGDRSLEKKVKKLQKAIEDEIKLIDLELQKAAEAKKTLYLPISSLKKLLPGKSDLTKVKLFVEDSQYLNLQLEDLSQKLLMLSKNAGVMDVNGLNNKIDKLIDLLLQYLAQDSNIFNMAPATNKTDYSNQLAKFAFLAISCKKFMDEIKIVLEKSRLEEPELFKTYYNSFNMFYDEIKRVKNKLVISTDRYSTGSARAELYSGKRKMMPKGIGQGINSYIEVLRKMKR